MHRTFLSCALFALCAPLPYGFSVTSEGEAGRNIQNTEIANAIGQLNVMTFGARGDCITDDSAAIQAAFTASHAQYSWNPIYFPIPPGGCYLTSTLNWSHETLIGQEPAGVVPSIKSAGVVIKGKPGEDILYRADINSRSAPARSSYTISNIAFLVDDSKDVSASNVHRWPGRFAVDGAMKAGSEVLTTNDAEVSCSDVGQSIEVFGAGPSGDNLVTSVANVSPCWPNGMAQTITLATAAGSSVRGATVYITPAYIPVTQHIGNCAIAENNYDADSAHWLQRGGSNADKFEHVSITSLSGGQRNNSCGIFWQGALQPYNLTVRDFYISRLVWAVVQATQDTNLSSSGYTSGADYQKWDHGYLGGTYPWISYNGSDYALEDIQMAGTNGLQVLQVRTKVEYTNGGWYLRIPEFEQATGVGDRFVGAAISGEVALCGANGTFAYLDTSGSNISGSCPTGTLNVYGTANHVDIGSFSNLPVEYGAQNVVTGNYFSNPYKSHEPSVRLNLTRNRGNGYTSGSITPDFVMNGNAASPYPNDGDLMIWPEDMYGGSIENDATSPTGRSFRGAPSTTIGSTGGFFHLGGWNTRDYSLKIGRDFPATGAILYVWAKCSVDNTAALFFDADGGEVQNQSFACSSTKWGLAQVTVSNLSAYSGRNFSFLIKPREGASASIAWAAIRPFQGDYNGKQPVLSARAISVTGSGRAVPSGPNSGVISGDPVCYTGTTGQQEDCGTGMPLTGTTGIIGGSLLSAGQCSTGTVSVNGATTSMVVAVSPARGTSPGTGYIWQGQVTNSGKVAVYVCAIVAGTPTSTTYNVRVIQ